MSDDPQDCGEGVSAYIDDVSEDRGVLYYYICGGNAQHFGEWRLESGVSEHLIARFWSREAWLQLWLPHRLHLRPAAYNPEPINVISGAMAAVGLDDPEGQDVGDEGEITDEDIARVNENWEKNGVEFPPLFAGSGAGREEQEPRSDAKRMVDSIGDMKIEDS
ncbi:Hypothetical predicted protein [Lecanosticta acicola]|uniref:Uncharacterized protein n=1 Tax=Lecanosticta acicola TaxID=111012 RepID=A0AAI8YX39_9PEZI|nr:Hypothetical predicted protein [Lecanosticta acicola]